MNATGPELDRLIQLLARLPGLGPRSARRAALHLIKKKDDLLVPLAKAMDTAVDAIVVCATCGNIDTSDPCAICSDPRRSRATLVVVEDVGPERELVAARVDAAEERLTLIRAIPDGRRPEDDTVAVSDSHLSLIHI